MKLFIPTTQIKMKAVLYSNMNTYITAEDTMFLAKRHKLRCNRTVVGDWEQFIIINTYDNKVALKTFHGKYISAQKNGFLHCNRKKIGSWEKFDLIKNNDNTYSFKSHHGKYVSFKWGLLFYFLIANSNEIKQNEKFIIKDYNTERIEKEQNDIVEFKQKIVELEKQIPEKERQIQLFKDQYIINRKAYDANDNWRNELMVKAEIIILKGKIEKNNIKIEVANRLITRLEKENEGSKIIY